MSNVLMIIFMLVIALLSPALGQTGTPHNFSGEVANPNAFFAAGEYGNMVGDATFGWQTSACGIDVKTNGFIFTIDSGSGNFLDYSGGIYGTGSIVINSAPAGNPSFENSPITLSGSKPNVYTGSTTIKRGRVELKKTAGVNAIPGNLFILNRDYNDMLVWSASNQIDDHANVTMMSQKGTLNIGNFVDTIHDLEMVDGSKINTGGTSGVKLTVNGLRYKGIAIAPGIYTSANAQFIVGSGSVQVLNVISSPSVIRIMPLGDSITYTPSSYRGFLYTMLTNAGFLVDFVGTIDAEPVGGLDPDNEGHWGATIGPLERSNPPPGYINTLWDNVANFMPENPDVILMLIGINDYQNYEDDEGNLIGYPDYRPEIQSVPKLSNLIDRIISYKPAVKLFVGSLLPVADHAKDRYPMDAFNAQIPGIVNSKVAEGKNVYFVDLHNESGIDANDVNQIYDGLHPAPLGGQKIANVWFNHITPYLVPTSPTITPTPSASPIPTITPPPGPPGTPHNFAGEVTNPNAFFSEGEYGNMIGDGSFGWRTSTSTRDVQTNGFTFKLDSGNGNAFDYEGAIYGTGKVEIYSSAFWASTRDVRLTLSGTKPNRYTGITTLKKGVVELAKANGVTAIPGNLVMENQGNNDMLLWSASHQIADTADLTINSIAGRLDLHGHSETIRNLVMVNGAQLAMGTGGSLTASAVTYNGVSLPVGTYTAANRPWITGTGQLIVTGQGGSTPTPTATALPTPTPSPTPSPSRSPLPTPTGTPHNFAGEVTNPNTFFATGEYGNMIGAGSFGWQTSTSTKDVQTNGFTFRLDTGNGNDMSYRGRIFGTGNVELMAASFWATRASAPLEIAGSNANYYTGTTSLKRGVIRLNKSAGVNAIPGDVIMENQGSNDRLIWAASNQIADTSRITVNSTAGKLEIGAFTESVDRLDMVNGSSIVTSSGGRMTVNKLRYNGVFLNAGTYSSSNYSWITGSGTVVVTVGGSW